MKEGLNIELILSDTRVCWRETVSAKSPVCLAKSPNKHNRLFFVGEPLEESLIESSIWERDEEFQSRVLVQDYHWDVSESRKIWAYGPDRLKFENSIVDCTKGVTNIHEIKDSAIAAFHWVIKEGIVMRNLERSEI